MALLGFVIFCGVLILCHKATSTVDSSAFCYDDKDKTCGPSNWPGTCQTGTNQSPIDIPLTSCHLENAVEKGFFISRSNLEYLEFTLTNTGHTARLETARDEKTKMTLSGPLFNNKNYTFAYVDWHWGRSEDDGSEHSLNGKRYALEAHMVHYRSDFHNVSQALASQERHVLLIHAIFYDITGHNWVMADLVRSLGKIQKAGQSTKLSNFVLQYVAWYQKEAVVVQYDGSLTTPDCNESILWNVFTGIEPISLSQLAEFRNLRDIEGKGLQWTNRPLQTANKRKIEYIQPIFQGHSSE